MTTDEDDAQSRPRLVTLQIPAFKSIRDQVLDISSLTILVGKNGSGKSNVIEALAALARLATGDRIVDALAEGADVSEPIRGLAQGSVPIGAPSFSLGCDVVVGAATYSYAVTIEASDADARVVSERLHGVNAPYGGPRGRTGVLLQPAGQEQEGAFVAQVFNGARGRDPRHAFRSDRLAITQLSNRLPESRASDLVINAAQAIRQALSEVAVIDPVPQRMREYVRSGDKDLRRSGDNLSATINAMRVSDKAAFQELARLLGQASESGVSGIKVERTKFDDVMFAVREHGVVVPARLMSDGLLRLAAIATAVLTSGSRRGRRVLVIEELENGLHPWLARDVLTFLKAAAEERDVVLIITTHSPTLMDALTAEEHVGVVLVSRDGGGRGTRLVRLTQAPGYVDATLAGPLGSMLETGTVGDVSDDLTRRAMADVFVSLLGA